MAPRAAFKSLKDFSLRLRILGSQGGPRRPATRERARLIGGIPSQLIGALSGLVQGHFPVAATSTYADDDAVLPALRAGAVGYLTKDVTGEALLAAVRDVAAGRTVLDPAVQQRLIELVTADPAAAGPGAPAAPSADVEGLTRREADVVRLVAQGLNNRQVAKEMFVSEATVKTHLNHILAKLAMQDRAALIAWAWRHGLANSTGNPS